MKNCMYVIFDSLAQSSCDPFVCPNDDVAKRHFAYQLSKMPSVAKDCKLLAIGEFDNESLEISGLLNPRSIMDYEQLIAEVSKNE